LRLIASDVRIVTQTVCTIGRIRANLGWSRRNPIDGRSAHCTIDEDDIPSLERWPWRGLPVDVRADRGEQDRRLDGTQAHGQHCRAHLKLPAHLVAPYAIADAIATLAL
jgi:hypothetical protein